MNMCKCIFFIACLSLAACLPQPPEYQSISACDKEEQIWQQVMDSQYTELPQWTGSEVGPLLMRVALDPLNVFGLVRDYLNVTVSHDQDEVPKPVLFASARTRVVHSYGSVAAIKFEAAEGQPFSGLYTGVPCGVVRLSLAGMPSNGRSSPGMGLKFLIDGKPSANFVAMFSLDGQVGYNFFKNNFSNKVSVPEDNTFLNFGLNLFELVTGDATMVDVAFMAELNVDGGEPVQVDAPWLLVLKPNAQLSFANSAHEFRDDLHSIAANTLLYKVYGKRRNQTQEIYIGDIVTKTPFVSSRYGDESLFFRHDVIDDRL